MSEKYQCSCGAKYAVRKLVKNGETNCPACGEVFPHKTIMRRYRRVQQRKFTLNCPCGKRYRITPPTGTFFLRCSKCGRMLLDLRPRELNGIELPRFIDRIVASK